MYTGISIHNLVKFMELLEYIICFTRVDLAVCNDRMQLRD